jgi:SAM-dependent methyltransferase
MKKSEVVTSPSKYLVNKVNGLGWLRDTDVDVIPYPVDLPKWNYTLPVSEAPPTVLFIGRLERLKAPELLAQAMAIIRKEIPKARAVFVGKSKGERDGLSYLEWIKKIAGNDQGCEFVGPVQRNELPRFFSQCRVLAITSWHDNYPMVALESMAAGRAVVVTQSTGVVELLKISKAGKIVPPGDPSSLAEALRPFLNDLSYAEEMGKKAKDTAFKILDPARLAAKREKAYLKAIDIFNHNFHAKVSGFRHALPEKVASFRVPREWRDWAISETRETPWKHFYLPTARHFLELFRHAPALNHSANLGQIRVLDVGCTPAVSILLAHLGADVTMLDIDLSELRKAQRYSDLLGVTGKVQYVCADALESPFNASTFDIVWNSGFIEHFDDPKQILLQMGHALGPKGLLIVLVPNRWTPHSLWIRDHLRDKQGGYGWDSMGRERSYTRRQLIRLLHDAGFCVVASSASNLRRSVLDDSWVLHHLSYLPIRSFLFRLMNSIDWMENHFPFFKHFGFMVGAAATKLPQAHEGGLSS